MGNGRTARLADVASGVQVATSRRDHTTSTVIGAGAGHDREVLLVDPAWDPDELADLGRELAQRGLTVTAGLSTHAHYDHLLWHPAFGGAPRYASLETARRADTDRTELLAGLGPDWPAALADGFARVEAVAGPMLAWAGPDVELIVHDAHIPGHTAAWIPALGLLVAGDMLSDVELPLPGDAGSSDTWPAGGGPPGNIGPAGGTGEAGGSGPIGGSEAADVRSDPLAAYADGLERLAPYVRRARLIIPGHGSPTADGQQRLDADRRYLDAVLAGHRCDDPRLAHAGMIAAHRANVAIAGAR